MIASEVGASSARRRIVGAVCGVSAVEPNMSSAWSAGVEQVTVRQRGAVADLREQIAAEQRPGRLLVEDVRVPPVWHVRRVDVADPLAAEIEHRLGAQGLGHPIGKIVHRHHATDRAVCNLRLRRDGEELVHCPALVGFEMAERDPAQALDGHDRRDGGRHRRKHGAGAGVEQQRLLGIDEELVEGEARRSDVGHERRQPEDPVGDLVNVGFHVISLLSEWERVGEHAGAGQATGQHPDELDRVDLDPLATGTLG